MTQRKDLALAPAVCAVGSTNMMNMEKVRFRAMETHFLISTYEIKKLQKENEELKMENELLKKLNALVSQRVQQEKKRKL